MIRVVRAGLERALEETVRGAAVERDDRAIAALAGSVPDQLERLLALVGAADHD